MCASPGYLATYTSPRESRVSCSSSCRCACLVNAPLPEGTPDRACSVTSPASVSPSLRRHRFPPRSSSSSTVRPSRSRSCFATFLIAAGAGQRLDGAGCRDERCAALSPRRRFQHRAPRCLRQRSRSVAGTRFPAGPSPRAPQQRSLLLAPLAFLMGMPFPLFSPFAGSRSRSSVGVGHRRLRFGGDPLLAHCLPIDIGFAVCVVATRLSRTAISIPVAFPVPSYADDLADDHPRFRRQSPAILNAAASATRSAAGHRRS